MAHTRPASARAPPTDIPHPPTDVPAGSQPLLRSWSAIYSKPGRAVATLSRSWSASYAPEIHTATSSNPQSLDGGEVDDAIPATVGPPSEDAIGAFVASQNDQSSVEARLRQIAAEIARISENLAVTDFFSTGIDSPHSSNPSTFSTSSTSSTNVEIPPGFYIPPPVVLQNPAYHVAVRAPSSQQFRERVYRLRVLSVS